MRHIITTNPGNTILRCLPKWNENICAPMFASSYSSSPICLSTHNWKNNLYAYPTWQTIPSTKRGKLVDMQELWKAGPEDRLHGSTSASQERETCKQKTDQGLPENRELSRVKRILFLGTGSSYIYLCTFITTQPAYLHIQVLNQGTLRRKLHF